MNDIDFSTAATPVHYDGGFRPGSAAPQQAEQLARRMAGDGDLHVHVPLRADGTPCTPELRDSNHVVGRLSLRAVELLEEDGRLALWSENRFRRTLRYAERVEAPEPKPAVTPEPAPEPVAEAEEDPQEQPSTNDRIDSDPEAPAMATTSERPTVTLPHIGGNLTTEEAAEALGLKHSTLLTYLTPSMGILSSDGEGKERYVRVDEKLLAQFDKREISYTFGGEACTEQPETCTESEGGIPFDDGGEQLNRISESKGLPPMTTEADEAVGASTDGLGGGWGPDDEDDEDLIADVELQKQSPAMAPTAGDGQTDDADLDRLWERPALPATDHEEDEAELQPAAVNGTVPQQTPFGPVHPMNELLDEVAVERLGRDLNRAIDAADRMTPPLEVLLDRVRDATIRYVHLALLTEHADEARADVARAVEAASDALDAGRHTLDEAERIAGLNTLPPFRTTSAPHDEEA